MGPLALSALVAVILLIVLAIIVIVYASRIKKVGPNEVLVVSGRQQKQGQGYRIVTGGRSFIWPILERVDYLSLELMTIDVAVREVYTLEGVPVMVDGPYI